MNIDFCLLISCYNNQVVSLLPEASSFFISVNTSNSSTVFSKFGIMLRKEDVNPDFSHSILAEKLLKIKNKNALIDSLHKLEPTKLNDLAYILLELEPIYKIELSKQSKKRTSKINEIDSKIVRAFCDLKTLPESHEPNEDFNYCVDLYKKMQSKTIVANETSKMIYKEITEKEKRMCCMSLVPYYVKAYFYSYLLKCDNVDKDKLANEFKISLTQLNRYLAFYEFIQSYPYVIRISLSFTFIEENLTKIKHYINNKQDIKYLCSTPCNMFN